MSCPYSDETLQKWDSVANPIGAACMDCDDPDCEHNLANYGDEDDYAIRMLHM